MSEPNDPKPAEVINDQNQHSAADQQEALLKVKYGGLLPKKKLMPKDQKYFDSADWQMGAQGHGLRPKLEPTKSDKKPVPSRQSSLLMSQGSQ